MAPSPHAKSELRVRIGRLRRRIDRHLRATADHGRRAVSWRSYAARYPGNLLLGALGLGLALSAGLSARRLTPWIGRRLLKQSLSQARKHVWREVERLWDDAEPTEGDRPRHSARRGGRHG
jgi:hypothetical protein